jgi:hypothetical protein
MDQNTQIDRTIDEVNYEDLLAASSVTTIDDEDFYALHESDITWENAKQLCLAQVKISKDNTDTSLYSTFDVELGARIYADLDDYNP